MCDSGDDITDVTSDVFILPHHQTPAFVPCEKVPEMDLRMWAECCTGKTIEFCFCFLY